MSCFHELGHLGFLCIKCGWEMCDNCSGTGYIDMHTEERKCHEIKCPWCDGEGFIEYV